MTQITRDLLILVLLCLLIVFLWFQKGLIFAGGEEGIPFYNLNQTVQLISYSWQDTSAGYTNQLVINRMPYFSFLSIFTSFGFPNFFVQALHFLIIMITGTISLYFLIRVTIYDELESKENFYFKLMPLVAAIFYLLNPFSMTQIWGRGLYMQFFPFALFPFFLLMFVLGLSKKNFIYGVAGLISSVFFAGSFGNPSYLFSFWAIISLYLSFYIFRNRTKEEIIFAVAFYFFMFVGWFLINMWWLSSFFSATQSQFASALDNTEANLGTVRGISKDYSFLNLIRFIHEGYFYRGLKYGESYTTLLFQLISWLVPIAALFSISIFKKNAYFLFFSVLILTALFICIGTNFPTGILFEFIFKNFPPFQAFRNPFEKFGVVLTLGFAPFFAIGLPVFCQWVSKLFKKPAFKAKIYFLFIFLFFGVFLWPIWTGQFAGGLVFNPWIKVPDYYKSLNDWLNEQPNDGRIIHFPINPGDGLRYSFEHSYQGIEPSEYIFNRPSIGKNGLSFKSYYSILLQRFNKFEPLTFGPDPDLSRSDFRDSSLSKELLKLNVRYIILHFDIDPTLGKFGEPESVVQYLRGQEDITKVKSFGKLDVYEVEGGSESGLIYSPQKLVAYKKIDPTYFEVEVADNKYPFDLYFLENFDNGWEMKIDDQMIDTHKTVFSYANGWKVDKTGNFRISIKYKHQNLINKGMQITKYSVLALCLLSLVILIFKLKKPFKGNR